MIYNVSTRCIAILLLMLQRRSRIELLGSNSRNQTKTFHELFDIMNSWIQIWILVFKFELKCFGSKNFKKRVVHYLKLPYPFFICLYYISNSILYSYGYLDIRYISIGKKWWLTRPKKQCFLIESKGYTLKVFSILDLFWQFFLSRIIG